VSKGTIVALALAAGGLFGLAVAVRNTRPVEGGPGLETSGEAVSGRLIIFHAGSLAVPFKQICEEFTRRYAGVKIVREAAGSRICARKIADLKRACDIMASADYTVIESLLIPEYADWNIKFAGNEMVIAFREDSRGAGRISGDNWFEILLEEDVTLGRSDPNSDPCGYRTALLLALAEDFYGRPGLAARLLQEDRAYIRPKEVDLLALLEAGQLDYIFIYRSVAEQYGLEVVSLPDRINLKKSEFADFYRTASVRIAGKEPGSFITKSGEPIVYGVTVPRAAPNREAALAFLKFLLDADKGGAILERSGHTLLVPSPTGSFERLPPCLRAYALPAAKEVKK
jgi:molybdate/tungstate transport system substrate-binding protein